MHTSATFWVPRMLVLIASNGLYSQTGHVLQRGGVDDDVSALDGTAQAVAVADVADEEAQPRIVELALHLRLLELIAAEDADGRRVPLRERGAREVLAEGARASGQQDGPALEMVHSRSSFDARTARG